MSCVGCHVDFEKIHSAFLAHYSKDPKPADPVTLIG